MTRAFRIGRALAVGLFAFAISCSSGGAQDSGVDAVAADAADSASGADGGCVSSGCASTQMCCPSSGLCVPAACTSCCPGEGDGTEPGTDATMTYMGPPCSTTNDCPLGDDCVFGNAGCASGTMGVCVTLEPCFRALGMYCGCNGQSFMETCAGPESLWSSMGACGGDGGNGG